MYEIIIKNEISSIGYRISISYKYYMHDRYFGWALLEKKYRRILWYKIKEILDQNWSKDSFNSSRISLFIFRLIILVSGFILYEVSTIFSSSCSRKYFTSILFILVKFCCSVCEYISHLGSWNLFSSFRHFTLRYRLIFYLISLW